MARYLRNKRHSQAGHRISYKICRKKMQFACWIIKTKYKHARKIVKFNPYYLHSSEAWRLECLLHDKIIKATEYTLITLSTYCLYLFVITQYSTTYCSNVCCGGEEITQ